jgi:hypothetical protein
MYVWEIEMLIYVWQGLTVYISATAAVDENISGG